MYKAQVLKGEKIGRTIGFPTINLDPTILRKDYKEGIYAAVVNYNNKEYKAALFFGPRKIRKETANVLEIYILNFKKQIYGKTILFDIKDFIRDVQNFKTLEDMKRQIEKDIDRITRHSSLSRTRPD